MRGGGGSRSPHSCPAQPPRIPLYTHERRINTEEKILVVAAVWGTESIQFLAALASSKHQDVFKKRMNGHLAKGML